LRLVFFDDGSSTDFCLALAVASAQVHISHPEICKLACKAQDEDIFAVGEYLATPDQPLRLVFF